MPASLLSQTRSHCSLLASVCWVGFLMKGAVSEVNASSVPHPEEPACREDVERCPVPANTNVTLKVQTMSWECPHQSGDDLTCDRLAQPCKPLSKGCVLYGKVQFIGQDQEATMKTSEKTTDTPDTANTLRPEQTVAEIVLRHPHLKPRLEQLGVDYCCGGKKPLADAVKDSGLDLKTVLADLEQTLRQGQAATPATDWAAVSLTILADHILDTHHVFTKTQLARIDALLAKVQNAHRNRHGTMLDSLRGAFDPLRAELEAHLMKEEQILFPAIKGIDGFLSGRNDRPVVPCGSVAHPIQQMEHEHDGAGAILVNMRKITHNYRLPDDACETFKALYEALAALEADLHEHIHLENNILFPASVAQEQQMNGKPS